MCFAALSASTQNVAARMIDADPTDYQSKVNSLVPGDTLQLAAGTYSLGLSLNNIHGSSEQAICIRGRDAATVFLSRECCNTISITKCSYLCISHLLIEGNEAGVDAVKAEGTAGNFAHHITLEYLTIHNFQSDQQVVGISTKCACWNWIIRKNRILGAGTGLYLGNSNGDAPFVNGLIEYNFVSGTIGYCMEIKHQVAGVRDAFEGTAVDGKTRILHNVFCKDSSSSTGSAARPNLLVGGFSSTGWGSKDFYEIAGNVFVENPSEALFQGSGSITLYNNIFINHSDGGGARAVYITSQNSIQPRDVNIFHNTVVANNSAGGIRIYNADDSYSQRCFANAVFAANPITNINSTFENFSADYASVSQHVVNYSTLLSQTNLVPQSDHLVGTELSDTLITKFPDAKYDFNGKLYDMRFRGAYASCCQNIGWQLQLDTMPQLSLNATDVRDYTQETIKHSWQTCIRQSSTCVRVLENGESLQIQNLLGQTLGEWQLFTQQMSVQWRASECGLYILRHRNASSQWSEVLLVVED